MSKIQLHNCDCLELLKTLPNNSVDLFLQDLPYNVTENKWEYAVDLAAMWKEWLRVAKPNAAFLFTAQQPFTTDLICSNRKMFRYDLIWKKGDRGSGFLNANRMPLRNHEDILVFYTKLPTYNPQFVKGNKNHSRGHNPKNRINNNYGKYDLVEQSFTNEKHPLSIIEFTRPQPPIHPTQKPIKLFEYLIKTYSNEGDTVFDGYLGSGTTAFAAHNTNRNFIGSELDKTYFDSMQQRFNLHASQSKLF